MRPKPEQGAKKVGVRTVLQADLKNYCEHFFCSIGDKYMRRLLPLLGLSVLGACASQPARKYVVFFSNQSVELNDTARNVIAEAARKAQNHPGSIVQVEGYAAAGGDLSADALIAIQRAKLVAETLHEDGVSGDRIRQTPRAPSSGEGMTVGARRVEIELVSP